MPVHDKKRSSSKSSSQSMVGLLALAICIWASSITHVSAGGLSSRSSGSSSSSSAVNEWISMQNWEQQGMQQCESMPWKVSNEAGVTACYRIAWMDMTTGTFGAEVMLYQMPEQICSETASDPYSKWNIEFQYPDGSRHGEHGKWHSTYGWTQTCEWMSMMPQGWSPSFSSMTVDESSIPPSDATMTISASVSLPTDSSVSINASVSTDSATTSATNLSSTETTVADANSTDTSSTDTTTADPSTASTLAALRASSSDRKRSLQETKVTRSSTASPAMMVHVGNYRFNGELSRNWQRWMRGNDYQSFMRYMMTPKRAHLNVKHRGGMRQCDLMQGMEWHNIGFDSRSYRWGQWSDMMPYCVDQYQQVCSSVCYTCGMQPWGMGTGTGTGTGTSSNSNSSNTPPSSNPVTHMINVGPGGQLVFQQPQLMANVGDTIMFNFTTGNHSVTQSTFTEPCTKMKGGFDSGFTNTAVNGPVMFAIKVKDTKPIWAYCMQGQHCQKGMVVAINPTADKTFAMFQQMAIASGNTSIGTAGNGTGSNTGTGSGSSGSGSGSSGTGSGSGSGFGNGTNGGTGGTNGGTGPPKANPTPSGNSPSPTNTLGSNPPTPTPSQSGSITKSGAATSTSSAATGTSSADAAAQSNSTNTNKPYTLPGTSLGVVPIGLMIFGGVSAIGIAIVGYATYERRKYRRLFRERQAAAASGGAGAWQQLPETNPGANGRYGAMTEIPV